MSGVEEVQSHDPQLASAVLNHAVSVKTQHFSLIAVLRVITHCFVYSRCSFSPLLISESHHKQAKRTLVSVLIRFPPLRLNWNEPFFSSRIFKMNYDLFSNTGGVQESLSKQGCERSHTDFIGS